MQHSLQIAVSVDRPGFLENMVEMLATRRYPMGYCNQEQPEGWKAIEASSAEMYVNGEIEFMFNEQEKAKMPFITCFLFICARSKNDTHKFNWSLSLS